MLFYCIQPQWNAIKFVVVMWQTVQRFKEGEHLKTALHGLNEQQFSNKNGQIKSGYLKYWLGVWILMYPADDWYVLLIICHNQRIVFCVKTPFKYIWMPVANTTKCRKVWGGEYQGKALDPRY